VAVVSTVLTALKSFAKANEFWLSPSVVLEPFWQNFLALMGNGSGYGSNSHSYTCIISSPDSGSGGGSGGDNGGYSGKDPPTLTPSSQSAALILH
jgi:hypothetical protein